MKQKLILASWATPEDFDCYIDSHGDCADTMDLAEPRGQLFSSVTAAKDIFLEQYIEFLSDEFQMNAAERNAIRMQTTFHEIEPLHFEAKSPNGSLLFCVVCWEIKISR